MKAKNKLDKYKYYISKRHKIFLHSFKKSQIKGRKIGPKVVLNSLPKSGTHLLEHMFLNMPLMRHCGRKTLMIETQNIVESKLKKIASLKKGQFTLGHMQYHKSIIKTTNDLNIKFIHLIRDPRDVLLSHLSYIQNMDLTQKSHHYIDQFKTRPEKLEAMLDGEKDILEPFTVVLNKFEPWIHSEHVHCIKFEDLIGEKGGGNKMRQQIAVAQICDFVGVQLKENQLLSLCDVIYSPKSSTFNKGKIGNWRHSLTSDEKIWLNEKLKYQIEAYNYSL